MTARIPIILWGLIFLVIPLVYNSAIYEGALIPKLLLFQIFMALLLLCSFWIVPSKFAPPPFLLLMLGFAVCHVQSVFVAINPTESILQLSQYLTFFIVPYLLYQTLSQTQIKQLLRSVPWVGLPIALIGMAQYHGLAFDGIPTNANPSATFFHRNAAAEYLIVTLPLAFVAFRHAKKPWAIVAHGFLLTLLSTYLLYTRTRGAWVGLAVATLIAIALYKITAPKTVSPKSLHTKILMVAFCIAMILGNLPANINRTGAQHFDEKKSDVLTAITSITTEQGHRGRLDLWQHTLYMILDHPIRGVGLGNWQYHYPNYSKGEQVDVRAAPIRPHNDLLWIAVETGLLSFIIYILLIATTLFWAWQLLQKHQDHTLVLGLISLILAHVIESFFNFPKERIAPALFFWFALGAVAKLYATQDTPTTTRFHRVMTCALLLICTGATFITFKRYQYDKYHLKVYVAERQRDWQTVRQYAPRALSYGDFRANTYIALGRAHYHLRDLDNAQITYENSLRLHPHSPNAYNNLGIVLRQKKQYPQAIAAFQKAIDLFPHFHQAANNLGNVYRVQKKWDLAIAAYQRAMALPNEPQVPYNLGMAFLQTGDVQKAQDHFLESLRRNPQFEPAHRALKAMGISAPIPPAP